MIHEESDEPPKKKLKGLAAILKHSLSLLTEKEITIPAIDVEPLEWWKSE